MRSIVLLALVGGFLPFLVAGQTLVESFRGEIRSCETACEKSYPGAEEDQVRLFSFCRNGCRLLNVIDVLDGFNDLNDTKLACFKCCQDSYSLGPNIDACKFGCESQVAGAEQRRLQVEEYCFNQQLDNLSPLLYISSIFTNMIEISSDRMIRSYYSQRISGGLVVVAAGSSLVSDSGDASFDDKSNNYMEMRGMIIGPVVDMPSPNDNPSSVIVDEPAENSLALKSDGVLARTGISRVLAFSLFVLAVLLVIWIWTGAPNAAAAAKQDRKLLLEKQNLKYLQCFDDSGELQLFIAPSSDDIKAGPPPDVTEKPMELIDIGSPFPLKYKIETV